MRYDLEELGLGCTLVVLFGIIALLLGVLVLVGVDETYVARKAFTATTACEAKRMDARRKFLSTEVVCVPAYRATKSDTLTLEGVK